MKHTLYAMLAASLAMLATSGIIAFATAAPSDSPAPEVEELTPRPVDDMVLTSLDEAVVRQLRATKARLGVAVP